MHFPLLFKYKNMFFGPIRNPGTNSESGAPDSELVPEFRTGPKHIFSGAEKHTFGAENHTIDGKTNSLPQKALKGLLGGTTRNLLDFSSELQSHLDFLDFTSCREALGLVAVVGG